MSTCDTGINDRYDATARPAFAETLRTGLRNLLREVRRRGELKERRRAFLNVASLDDRMLADIGLTRSDVETAASLPLEINASQAVRQIAADRRAAERRMRRT